MIDVIIIILQTAESVLFFLVIVHVLLSYVMQPYHWLRQNVDRVVEPMLAPIRRVLPKVAMLDFSPFVLIILVQLTVGFLIRFLQTMR